MENFSFVPPAGYRGGPAVSAPPYRAPRRMTNRKIAVLVISLVLLGILLIGAFVGGILGLVNYSLEKATEREEYALALDYLQNSRALARVAKEGDTIYFNSFSYSTKGGEKTSVFGFRVSGVDFEVTCHDDGGGWYVCTECTEFR